MIKLSKKGNQDLVGYINGVAQFASYGDTIV